MWFCYNSEDGEIEEKVEETAQRLAELDKESVISVARKRGGHTAWEWAFFQHRLRKWLFEQKLPKPERSGAKISPLLQRSAR